MASNSMQHATSIHRIPEFSQLIQMMENNSHCEFDRSFLHFRAWTIFLAQYFAQGITKLGQPILGCSTTELRYLSDVNLTTNNEQTVKSFRNGTLVV